MEIVISFLISIVLMFFGVRFGWRRTMRYRCPLCFGKAAYEKTEHAANGKRTVVERKWCLSCGEYDWSHKVVRADDIGTTHKWDLNARYSAKGEDKCSQ